MKQIVKIMNLAGLAAITAVSLPAKADPAVRSCVQGRSHLAKASNQLSVKQVMEIAEAVMKRQGKDLAKFEPPSVCFDASKNPAYWNIFFDGIDGEAGNHSLILINDKDRTAEYYAGL